MSQTVDLSYESGSLVKPEVRVSHRFSVSPGHGVVSDSSSVRMAPHQNNRATFSRAVLLFMAAARMQAVRVIIDPHRLSSRFLAGLMSTLLAQILRQ